MKIGLGVLGVFMLGLVLVSGGFTPALCEEKGVRAKIGIQVRSGEEVTRAKARDRLKAGDLLRIYVYPEERSYVYVVHTDHRVATLLNREQLRIEGLTLIMPSGMQFYEVDGKSAVETFTLVCSPRELEDLQTLLGSGEVSYTRWAEFEKALLEKGRIDLAGKPERPFPIAGTVRGAGDSAGADPFLSRLQIFTGKSILVKKYEFRVKK